MKRSLARWAASWRHCEKVPVGGCSSRTLLVTRLYSLVIAFVGALWSKMSSLLAGVARTGTLLSWLFTVTGKVSSLLAGVARLVLKASTRVGMGPTVGTFSTEVTLLLAGVTARASAIARVSLFSAIVAQVARLAAVVTSRITAAVAATKGTRHLALTTTVDVVATFKVAHFWKGGGGNGQHVDKNTWKLKRIDGQFGAPRQYLLQTSVGRVGKIDCLLYGWGHEGNVKSELAKSWTVTLLGSKLTCQRPHLAT